MDEASIIKALRADLQDYKIKTQVRRKESQLHVLVTRNDGDDLDYAAIYNIVKNRIANLSIEGVDSLTVYGKLTGANHPEWQKKSAIAKPLPLIELDLDELDETSPIAIDSAPPHQEHTQTDSTMQESQISNELKDFKTSLEDDLKSLVDNDDSNNTFEDLHDLDNLNLPMLGKVPFSELEPDTFNLDSSRPKAPNNLSDDYLSDSPTLAAPLPMPLPPVPTRKILPEVHNSNTKLIKTKIKPNYKKPLVLGAFIATLVGVLGACGWVVWDRFNQQNYLADARNLDHEKIDIPAITNLETLTTKRNQIQGIVSQLESISNNPISLYSEAQSELNSLRPKLAELDRKVAAEQLANKNLELAKSNTLEAAKSTQQPPHSSKIWLAAQEKRQQALTLLGEIPADSLLYADAQSRLKLYRNELIQINRWLDIQKRAESAANSISPNTVKQLQQLKSTTEKPAFINQCRPLIQSQILSGDSQRTGLTTPNLTSYLCAYFWDLQQ
ncbi:hypothetical protein [Pseudanabaena mucicola]|nr:hypothetical protein [Pseudanabaena mucicola]